MRIATLPAVEPNPHAQPTLTALEPWQREGLERLREELGVDEDAVIRAGLTLVLLQFACSRPDIEGAAPPEDAASLARRLQRQMCQEARR